MKPSRKLSGYLAPGHLVQCSCSGLTLTQPEHPPSHISLFTPKELKEEEEDEEKKRRKKKRNQQPMDQTPKDFVSAARRKRKGGGEEEEKKGIKK